MANKWQLIYLPHRTEVRVVAYLSSTLEAWRWNSRSVVKCNIVNKPTQQITQYLRICNCVCVIVYLYLASGAKVRRPMKAPPAAPDRSPTPPFLIPLTHFSSHCFSPRFPRFTHFSFEFLKEVLLLLDFSLYQVWRQGFNGKLLRLTSRSSASSKRGSLWSEDQKARESC